MECESLPGRAAVGRTANSAALGALARSEQIYKTVKFSDHAPITVDYEFTL